MRKLIFIIALFFSVSVFAETWVEVQPQFGLDFYQSQGYEVVDVKAFQLSTATQFIYTLTHPEGGFKICTVYFEIAGTIPTETYCFTEDITD